MQQRSFWEKKKKKKRVGEGDVGSQKQGWAIKVKGRERWRYKWRWRTASCGSCRWLACLGRGAPRRFGAQTETHTGPEADTGVRLYLSEWYHPQLRMSNSRSVTPCLFCFWKRFSFFFLFLLFWFRFSELAAIFFFPFSLPPNTVAWWETSKMEYHLIVYSGWVYPPPNSPLILMDGNSLWDVYLYRLCFIMLYWGADLDK